MPSRPPQRLVVSFCPALGAPAPHPGHGHRSPASRRPGRPGAGPGSPELPAPRVPICWATCFPVTAAATQAGAGGTEQPARVGWGAPDARASCLTCAPAQRRAKEARTQGAELLGASVPGRSAVWEARRGTAASPRSSRAASSARNSLETGPRPDLPGTGFRQWDCPPPVPRPTTCSQLPPGLSAVSAGPSTWGQPTSEAPGSRG